MNKTERNTFKRWAASLMLLLTLFAQLAPVAVHALDVQPLPENTKAATGFTHVMNLKYSDVTNGVIYSQWRVFPRSGTFANGDVVDRLGLYLESPFYVTNANAGSNAVFLNVGITGVTNACLNNYPVGSNKTYHVFTTNLVAPIFISAATNFLQLSLTYSNAEMPALTSQGEMHLFFRVTRFDALKNY